MSVRLQHLLFGSSVQHMGPEDIGDGEVIGCDELAVLEPTIELLQAHLGRIM